MRGAWTRAAVAVVVWVIAQGCVRREDRVARPAPADAPPAQAGIIRADRKVELDGGVRVREVQLDRSGAPMTVWIYQPASAGRRPVVLIAASGNLLGARLVEGDRAEHLPWAREGYVVVAYSVDGPGRKPESEAAFTAGMSAFAAARGGVENATAALRLALAGESDADPQRVYAVGHSSAGTLALRVGAELAEVKAIVAMNAVADVERRFRSGFLEQLDARAAAALRDLSPMAHVAALRSKPVYLFHTVDDSAVPVGESRRLRDALGDTATLHVVPSGDHYDGMIAEGIPAAIAWLGARSR